MSNPDTSAVTEIAISVWDADSQEHVSVTSEMRTKAMGAVQQIMAGTVVLALNIKRIKDERLYLAIPDERGKPFQSWKTFVDEFLIKAGIGYANAQRFYRIADTFDDFLGRMVGGENGDVFLGENRKLFSIKKLDELTRFPKEQIDQLNESDLVTLEDGRVLSYKELLNLSLKEITDARKSLEKENATLQEQVTTTSEALVAANDRLASLGESEGAAKLVGELEIRIQELEGAKITADKAEATAAKIYDEFSNRALSLESIPLSQLDEATRTKILSLFESHYARMGRFVAALRGEDS